MALSRPKIGVFIDYSLRIPSVIKSYELFKSHIFNITPTDFDTEEVVENDIEENASLDVSRFFWKEELKKPEVELFYAKSKIEKEDYELRTSDWKEYFYNEEHWKKFLEEYTFNLYADADFPCKKDIDFLNVAQSYLFDVILIDEYIVPRKKLNTMYFLSKIRVMPQAVLFLGPGQNTSEETYFGIWNPKKYKDQENKEGYSEFEMWLKELESKLK